MMSQPGKQTIAIHILPNISRCKDNQTIKFDQLITYKTRYNFLKKSYTKCGGKLFPDSFLENENWVYLWINSVKFYKVCFYCMLSWGLSK